MENKLPATFKLPQIQDLISEKVDILALEETNQLNILLNQQPPANWLKANPLNPKLKYLPIERVEYLLTRLFYQWRAEVKEVQLIGNSVQVTVKLHYFNITTGEWDWQDGVGASPLQTDSGAGAIEFNKLKSGAVMMAVPAAKSYAIKDAAECIGAIFGKNLNRADKANYDSLAENPAFKKKHEDLFDENEPKQ